MIDEDYMLSVRLRPDMYDRLRKRCDDEGRTISSAVKEALRMYLLEAPLNEAETTELQTIAREKYGV